MYIDNDSEYFMLHFAIGFLVFNHITTRTGGRVAIDNDRKHRKLHFALGFLVFNHINARAG